MKRQKSDILEVIKALDDFLSCGILRHGCALACCESCTHSELIAFSCKRRTICPSCDAKRSHIFAEHLHENILLKHPHEHAVFTIPIRLRAYFIYDRGLFSQLYHAAWSTWNEYITAILPGNTAAVMALHSAGALLNWHPHIHSLLLAGTIDENNNFQPIKNIDSKLLQEAFAEKVFGFLLEKELITQDIVDSMKAWSHSGFKLWLDSQCIYQQLTREAKFKALLENNFQPLELDTAELKPVSKYWATWIKKVYEVDPLLCPKCSGTMKIKSFIHSTSQIKKLCENLGMQDWRAPPVIGKNSTTYIDTSTEFAQ